MSRVPKSDIREIDFLIFFKFAFVFSAGQITRHDVVVHYWEHKRESGSPQVTTSISLVKQQILRLLTGKRLICVLHAHKLVSPHLSSICWKGVRDTLLEHHPL